MTQSLLLRYHPECFGYFAQEAEQNEDCEDTHQVVRQTIQEVSALAMATLDETRAKIDEIRLR